ncbi:NUDIX hydrolase family protein [Iodobacter sp.]|uniref:NUDIX hydrolase n=1 Tax=Iodobacter sp. TaxID=1915058 RepID=UPI0025EE7576|nr:DUF4743 domain-containing protein [Iodobacter sp.]
MQTAPLRRFIALDQPLGWLEDISVQFLSQYKAISITPDSFTLDPQLNAQEVAAWLYKAALDMRAAGLIQGWRNENYSVFAPTPEGDLDLSHPLFELERAAFRRFGLTSRAVHINGYTSAGELWIGQRASSKATDPNRLDNLAAGGISAGEAVWDCMIRELAEEAGVPLWIAQNASYQGSIRSSRVEADGTQDEILYIYDLLLPQDFVPNNRDGEMAEFRLYPFAAIDAALGHFTADAALVTQSFLKQLR